MKPRLYRATTAVAGVCRLQDGIESNCNYIAAHQWDKNHCILSYLLDETEQNAVKSIFIRFITVLTMLSWLSRYREAKWWWNVVKVFGAVIPKNNKKCAYLFELLFNSKSKQSAHISRSKCELFGRFISKELPESQSLDQIGSVREMGSFFNAYFL